MSVPINHEVAFVKAFIDPNRTERYLEFIASPKKRVKLIKELAHFKALNPACIVRIPTSQRNASSIIELLKSKGAGSKCWMISENAKLDGREVDLETALKETVGYQMGTLISCVPGRLGYFEDEEDRYILERARFGTGGPGF